MMRDNASFRTTYLGGEEQEGRTYMELNAAPRHPARWPDLNFSQREARRTRRDSHPKPPQL